MAITTVESPLRTSVDENDKRTQPDWDGNAPKPGKLATAVLVVALSMSPVVSTSAVSAAPSSPVDVQVIRNQWTSNGGYLTSERRGPQSQAEAVKSLRERSGLTWDELARLFGVSRRSVHNWATGGRMTSKHANRLTALTASVDKVDTGSSDATRNVLLTPDSQGRSLFDALLSTARARGHAEPAGPKAAVRVTSGSTPTQLGNRVTKQTGTLRDRS